MIKFWSDNYFNFTCSMHIINYNNIIKQTFGTIAVLAFLVLITYFILQVFTSEINIYMWDPSAESVTSNIATLDITRCDNNARSKRSVPLSPSVPFSVTLPFKPVAKDAHLVNETFDIGHMVYHTLNLSLPLKTVIVTIDTFNENDTFEVLVNINDRPSPTHNLTSFIIPRPENETFSDTAISEEEWASLMNTIHINTTMLSTYYNSSIQYNYVTFGIRRLTPGM